VSTLNASQLPAVAAPKPLPFPAEANGAAVLPTGPRRASESSALSQTGVSESFSRRTSVNQPATHSQAGATRAIEVELLKNPAYEDALVMLRPVVGGVLSVLSTDLKGQINTRVAATMLDMQIAPLLKGIATLDPQAAGIAMTALVQIHMENLGTVQLQALSRGISAGRLDGTLAAHSGITANMQFLVDAKLAANSTSGV